MKKDVEGLPLKKADIGLQGFFILYCLFQILIGDGDGYVNFYLGLFFWQWVSIIYWRKRPAAIHLQKLRSISGTIMVVILVLLLMAIIFSMLEPRQRFQVFPESTPALVFLGLCVIGIPISIFYYLYLSFSEFRQMEERNRNK